MNRSWRSAKPVRFALDMVELVLEKRLLSAAGALACFLILSVFPALICINFFVGVLDLDLELLLDAVTSFLPSAGAQLLADYAVYLSENQSPGLLWAGLFGVGFSASAAFRQLLSVTDALYGRKRFRGLHGVAVSVGFSLLMLFTIYLSVFVLFTGGWFLSWLGSVFPLDTLPWSWTRLRFLVLFSFLLLFILLLYRLSAPPDGKSGANAARPPLVSGAVLAALALVISSMVFSHFLERSSRYSLVYGSLASVIVLMVWLYLCGCIVILGAVFNCVLYRHRLRK